MRRSYLHKLLFDESLSQQVWWISVDLNGSQWILGSATKRSFGAKLISNERRLATGDPTSDQSLTIRRSSSDLQK